MGYIKRLGKNHFGIFVEAGKDPRTGKRQRIYRAFYGNEREARKELARLETEIAQGTFMQPTKMTVTEYLRWWLEQHAAAKKLADKTVESYTFLIEKYLIPSFGALPLEQLHSMHIQNYITKANKTLSPRTVSYSITILRLALKHAVKKWKLIKENPAEVVETPGEGIPRQNALSEEEMLKFLQHCEGKRDYPIIYTALYTGMRRGELLGLHWQDVDLEEGKIEVKWTLQRITGKGLVFKPAPKTKAGFRTVELPPSVVTLLKQLRREQAENKLFFGPEYQDNDLVFSLPDGRPLDPPGLSRRFHKLAVEAGFPNLRFHDQRHTHATLMFDNGEDVRVVQKRLGHKKPSTTANIYGDHINQNKQRLAANRFDEKYGFKKNSAGPRQVQKNN